MRYREHITATEQSKGSVNRQVTLLNVPHKPQKAYRSKQPVGDIEYHYQHSINPIKSGCTRISLFHVSPALKMVLKSRKVMRVLHELCVLM